MSVPNPPPLPTESPSLPVRIEVDDQHPWLGLDAFTEKTSEYFYGRAAEAEELFRRVKREPLTVLFGMSGLGKTSLVLAGLFPALRAEGFLPVYIRLDHEPAAKAPKAPGNGGAHRGDQSRTHLATHAARDRGNALGVFPSRQPSSANLESPADHAGARFRPVRGALHPWRPRRGGAAEVRDVLHRAVGSGRKPSARPGSRETANQPGAGCQFGLWARATCACSSACAKITSPTSRPIPSLFPRSGAIACASRA